MSEDTSHLITILFGTETGNSEGLARGLSERAIEKGYETEVLNLGELKVDELQEMGFMVIVTSTWGEGDPPGAAEDFCLNLYDAQKPDLSHCYYSVVALGDTSYEDFCGCGRRVDESLAKLKATKFMDRKELDVEFEDDYKAWEDEFFAKLAKSASVKA